ncbi:TetR family transcriptional regulator [Motilibacter rhizosphaerae]|uniref:TetR family transcriptional regulator n=1 Tax=Motilibacter rhizosphaerae TaxID=598652 RepID=A0A4V2F553_9ACTN|nr:TetR family transcriptional regulator [Motilibacter rhizosphaerae]RZS91619.1 TetR family transcriptional regulator [Motilibacter rhizosphaerae]
MTSRGSTVDWTTALAEPPAGAEGARERKKRETRQLLSSTATQMFLERGFDAVRVTEVAAACGVSEKTVYNYFPTKESLVLDRWDSTRASLGDALAAGTSVLQAVLDVLTAELDAVARWLSEQEDQAGAVEAFGRFGLMLRSTPSLRAHQRDAVDGLGSVLAAALAERAGLGPAEPEPQIGAHALLGLWQVRSTSLVRHLPRTRPARLTAAVMDDVRRAAAVLHSVDDLGDEPREARRSVRVRVRPHG